MWGTKAEDGEILKFKKSYFSKYLSLLEIFIFVTYLVYIGSSCTMKTGTTSSVSNSNRKSLSPSQKSSFQVVN